MTKSGPEGHTLESVVQQFSAAESALRELVLRSEELASAELRVDQARASVELATTDLGKSREAVESGATGLHALAAQLEKTGREFASAAQALNEIKPDEIMTVGEETQATVHQLGTRLGQTKDELIGLHQRQSEASTEIQKSLTDLGTSVGDVRIAISSVVSQVSNDANETRAQLRSIEGEFATFRGSIAKIADANALIAKRQTMLLVLIALTLVAAAFAAALGLGG